MLNTNILNILYNYKGSSVLSKDSERFYKATNIPIVLKLTKSQ
ncbi:hypothetical protein CCAND95_810003 [Capnocytophaga canis]|uniref:Uncharacterized protein n=1 Tax=Capnocytophaga canis TaxID=1848903 RepID=A0A0B7IV95_9FLAO|nr:hypothetical protein CCAND95_810003 [Capnocytophaga canis]CEN49023.1 hypothetical protein CCAND38_740010 [Capnocytophaga canis]CEN54579.1 hypothetical protein CCAND93_960010 [Capnocytophaga canis]